MGKYLPINAKAELIRRAEQGEPISQLCREAGISRTIFYHWLNSCRQNPQAKVSAVLAPRRPQGQDHWRKLPQKTENRVVKEAVKNPWTSPAAIGTKAGISAVTAWKILKDHKLNTRELRENYLYIKGPKLISSSNVADKVTMIRRFEAGENVSQICRDFGISRTIFYRWLKRYQSVSEENKRAALESQRPSGEAHWRYVKGAEEAILRLVMAHPEYSVHEISRQLPMIDGKPMMSSFGIYTIFNRLNLNTYERRLAYASKIEEVQALPAPVSGLGWSRQIFGRIPKVSAIPPPKILTAVFVVGVSLLIASWVRMAQGYTLLEVIGLIFSTLSLLTGTIFFLYSLKYYLTLAMVLSFSQQSGEQEAKEASSSLLAALLGAGGGKKASSGPAGLKPNLDHVSLSRYPKICLQIPFYNEKNVAERAASAAINLDYPEFEVILADDSTDDTPNIIKNFQRQFGPLKITKGEGYTLTEVSVREGVTLKHLHRTTRSGFKGAALNLALQVTDPKTEFIAVFDADFVPYPDTLTLFLKYFKVQNNGSEDYTSSKVAAVQGYQWHVLNKSENWITRGIRTEYAGSYVIERAGTELYGGLKMISGSVYMIRKDPLQKVGWGSSITEDFELTLRLYEAGYKVVYTPYIQAPAECVSTFKRLIRQRMRWAEGHSFNIKLMLRKLLVSQNLTGAEKFETVYLAPYYLQAFFFLLGTFSWLLAEVAFQVRLPFWTSLWGWSLVLTNMLSLPLVNIVGLFLEESEEKDYLGIASFVVLCYLIVPFQAYAAVKGFTEEKEGGWFRTPKTGRVTDVFTRGTFYRLVSGIFSGSRAAFSLSANSSATPYLALTSANSRFDSFALPRRGWRYASKAFLAMLLLVTNTVLSLAPYAPYFSPAPAYAQGTSSGVLLAPGAVQSGSSQILQNTSSEASQSAQTISVTPTPTPAASSSRPSVSDSGVVAAASSAGDNTPTPTTMPAPTIVPTPAPGPTPTVAPSASSSPSSTSSGSLPAILSPVLSLKDFLSGKFSGLNQPSDLTGQMSLEKTSLKAEEVVKVNIGSSHLDHLGVKLTSYNGEVVPVVISEEDGTGSDVLVITQKGTFVPGKYTLSLTDTGGKVISLPFSWGTLALNSSSSLYKVGERASLYMEATGDSGHLLCDANLALTITTPSGLTLKPAIMQVHNCRAGQTPQNPDYTSAFTLSEVGTYTITLINTDTNAAITSYIKTEVKPQFTVTRQAPVRIYSKDGDQRMKFTLTTVDDFTGLVKETVPAGVSVASVQPSTGLTQTPNLDGSATLTWTVNLKGGKAAGFSYIFQTSAASPVDYSFGPLIIQQEKEITPTPTLPSARSNKLTESTVSATPSAQILGASATASPAFQAYLANGSKAVSGLQPVTSGGNLFAGVINEITSITTSIYHAILQTLSHVQVGGIGEIGATRVLAQELTAPQAQLVSVFEEGNPWVVYSDTPAAAVTLAPTTTPTPAINSFFDPTFALPKKAYQAGESVNINLGGHAASFYRFTVLDSFGEKVNFSSSAQTNGSSHSLQLNFPQGTHPGKMTLQITGSSGKVMSQDFLWGVLAINTDKTVYVSGESAYIQMASLDNNGHTLCTSNLTLTVTTPEGVVLHPGVRTSPTCGPDNFTNSPDYFAYISTFSAGQYDIQLTNTDNGADASSFFVVRSGDPLAIQRVGATRINPFLSAYTMTMKVTAARRITNGVVEEAVPAGFVIKSVSPASASSVISAQAGIQNNGAGMTDQKIDWNINLAAGKSATLSYTYQAPKISPALYALGPSRVSEKGQVIFTELHPWQLALDPKTTTLGDGTNPSNVTIGPGGAATDLDAFTLQTSAATDTVTALTVTLNSYTGIGQADITDTSNTAQCTSITNPASTTLSFTGCNIAVTTTLTTFKVRITPKSASAMPAPPGGSYAITGTVTAFTSTNAHAGSDGASATVTIDNLSPNGATSTSGSVGGNSVTINWTTSSSTDFSQSVLLRWTASTPGSDVPAEGSSYSAGNTIGSATVACVRTTDAYSTAVNCTDTTVTNGTTYSYKIFQADGYLNYDTGVTITGSPFTPYPSIGGTIYQSDETTPDTTGYTVALSVNNAAPTTTTVSAGQSTFTFSGITAAAGAKVMVYISGATNNANTTTIFGAATISNLNLYIGRLAVTNNNSSSTTNANICSFSTYPPSGDNLFTCDGSNNLTVSGSELHVMGSYAPGTNVTTPELHIVTGGTYSGSTETLTLTGSGQTTSRPLYINGGTFTAPATTTFTGTSASDIEATTYNALSFAPASGTQIYYLNSGTLTVNGNFTTSGAGTLTVNASTNNPAINITGNLTIGSGHTFSASGSAGFTISGNFTNNGTFTANSGTVTFNGAGASVLTYSVATSFYNLTVSTASKEVDFDHLHQTNVTGTLTASGGACSSKVKLYSDLAGSQYALNVSATGAVRFADIKDSNNIARIGAIDSSDSGDNSNWVITSDTCGGAADGGITAYSFQRKTFYDATGGSYWRFSYDSTGLDIKIEYSASPWNTGWTAISPLAENTADFSVFKDYSSSYIYIAYFETTGANSYSIMVRRGTVSATNISWDASGYVALTGSSSSLYHLAYIGQDTNGYLWVLGQSYSTTGGRYIAMYGVQSTSIQNPSSWNAAVSLSSGTNTDPNLYGALEPAASGNIYATWIRGTAIEGKKWISGSGWQTLDSIATGQTGFANGISTTFDSSYNTHLAYIDSSGYVQYKKYNGTSWDASPTRVDSTGGMSSVSITSDTANGDIYVLYIKSATPAIYYSRYFSGSWGTKEASTGWTTGTTPRYLTASLPASGRVFAEWTSGTSSPYTLNWNYIIIPERLVYLLSLGVLIPLFVRRKTQGKRGRGSTHKINLLKTAKNNFRSGPGSG